MNQVHSKCHLRRLFLNGVEDIGSIVVDQNLYGPGLISCRVIIEKDDVDGIRVASAMNGIVTNYVVDKNRDYAQVLEERNSAGSLTVSYIYGDDLVSQKRPGSDGYVVSYYHYDGQLSTRVLTDAAGEVTDAYIYDAFGVLPESVGDTVNNYLYTGEQFDPNAGFYHLRARYYGQAVGRFVAADPYQGNINEPVTLHKYLYASNNPVMLVDPSGEFFATIGDISTGMAMSSVLMASNLSVMTGILHLIDYKTPIEWKGDMYAGSFGLEGIGIGGIQVTLESKCRNGKKAKGKYILAVLGFVIPESPLPGPWSYSQSSIEVTTPGMLGADPRVLQGHCLWLSISVVAKLPSGFGGGFHTSFTSLYMGAGIAKISPPFEATWGYDMGYDFMGGLSIGIPGTLKENILCP